MLRWSAGLHAGAGLVLALALTGCADLPVALPGGSPSLAISDGSTGGNSHFFFLPPLVKKPSFDGTFDATLSPVVRITADDVLLEELSAAVNADKEYYEAVWDTRGLGLDATAAYRATVWVNDEPLGFVDIALVANKKQAKTVDGDVIALVDGRRLKIRFRIEEGALPPPPLSNHALDFADAWVTVPDHADLDLGATFTLEAWIKPHDVTGGNQHLISKWDGAENASYTLEVNGGRLRSAIHDGVNESQWYESNATLTDDRWQHVAITLDNGTLRLYVDGTLDRTVTGSQTPMNSDRPVSFGREGEPYGGWRYDGQMDEIRIWNVARTQEELVGAMTVSLTGTETGLVGWWTFDEGEGDVAADATGNGHDGRLGSAAGADDNDPAWTEDAAPLDLLTVFFDQGAFVTASGATATVTFPTVRDLTTIPYSENGLTFVSAAGFNNRIDDFTPIFDGNEFAVSGAENVDISAASDLAAFGFWMQDGYEVGFVNDVKQDSRFAYLFRSQGELVGAVYADPDVDVAFFLGVMAARPFDRIEVRELRSVLTDLGDTYVENDFFSTIYTVGAGGS